MNQTTIFRFLILASLALAVLGTFLDLVVPGLLPAGLEAAYEADGVEEPALLLVLLLGAVSLILLVGGIVATVGLLLFKPWSRAAALWLTALSLVIYPFLGPFLQSGWAFMLYEVAMMFWGAALAMAYFSELRPRFDRQSH